MTQLQNILIKNPLEVMTGLRGERARAGSVDIRVVNGRIAEVPAGVLVDDGLHRGCRQRILLFAVQGGAATSQTQGRQQKIRCLHQVLSCSSKLFLVGSSLGGAGLTTTLPAGSPLTDDESSMATGSFSRSLVSVNIQPLAS